jgi:mono/diheme cytochrome c family protein
MWAINLRIFGVVLGTLALYTLIANKIPQMQSEVPRALALGANVTPEQLVSAGDQLYQGAGGCTACHGLGTRAPNLLTDEKGQGPIGARCASRESGKGCKTYLYESLTAPGKFVVSGYEPIMPDLSRTLSPQQLWALVAYLESLGGNVDVTGSDIPAASAASAAGSGAPGAARFANGSTDAMEIIRAGGCLGCHKLGAEGGAIGPVMTGIGRRLSPTLLREAILTPDARIARGYEQFKGVMPKTFGDQLSAAQLEALVQFLASQR